MSAAAGTGGNSSLINRILAAIGGVVSRATTYTGAIRTGIAAELERSTHPDFLSELVAKGAIPNITTLTYTPTTSLRNVKTIMGAPAATEDEAAGRDRMVAAYNLAVTVAELKKWTGYEGETQAAYMAAGRKGQALGAIARLEENAFVYTQRFLRDFYLYIFATTRAQNSRRSIATTSMIERVPSTVSAPGYPTLKIFSVDDMFTIQAIYADIDDEIVIGDEPVRTYKPRIRAVIGEVPVNGAEKYIPANRYPIAEELAQELGGYKNRIYLTLARRSAVAAAAPIVPFIGPVRKPNFSGKSGIPTVPQPNVFETRGGVEDVFRKLTGPSNTEKEKLAAATLRTGAEVVKYAAGQAARKAGNVAMGAFGGLAGAALGPPAPVPALTNGSVEEAPSNALGSTTPSVTGKRLRRNFESDGAGAAGPSAKQARTEESANAGGSSTAEGGAYRRRRRTHKRQARRRAHRVKASRRRVRKAGRR